MLREDENRIMKYSIKAREDRKKQKGGGKKQRLRIQEC